MGRIFYFTTRDQKLQGDFQELSILAGLRNVYGDRVIDIPKKKVIYGDFSESPKNELHGRGFNFCDGDVPDIDDSLRREIPQEDDIIIYGTVEYGILNENRDHGKCKNVFYIDGGDVPDIRIKPCFKREMFREEDGVYPTGFGIPKSSFYPIDFDAKIKLIPITSPDTDLMEEFGTEPKVHFHPVLSQYAFSDKKEYMDDIAESWFFPVTRRGGFDSMRPYEGIAYGTLVIFKNYEDKPKLCSPQDFPCFTYSSVEELKELMGRLLINGKPTEEYKDMLAAQRNWLFNFGTCEARAKNLVEKIEEILYEDQKKRLG